MSALISCKPHPMSDTTNLANEDKHNHAEHTLRLAVASNFASVMPSLVEAYQNQDDASPSINFDITYASSGKLYTQINAGAPYDLFLSANQLYPNKLAQNSNQNELIHIPFTYAQGQLSLYSNKYSFDSLPKVDDSSINDHSNSTKNPLLHLLSTHPDSKVVIANPELAPYGASAKTYLKSLDIFENLETEQRLIQAENINQAFQYTQTKNVDIGLVAYSQIIAADIDAAHYRLLDKNSYPAILQDGIVVSDSRDADDFASFIQSKPAKDLLSQAGYIPVGGMID